MKLTKLTEQLSKLGIVNFITIDGDIFTLWMNHFNEYRIINLPRIITMIYDFNKLSEYKKMIVTESNDQGLLLILSK